MRLSRSNIAWKGSQSLLGFALLAIQSRFLGHDELALFAIAQSLIVVVSLVDFGLGVKIVNEIADNLNRSRRTNNRLFYEGFLIISQMKKRILLVSSAQSILFLGVFQILTNKIANDIGNLVYIIFFLSVFLNSVGNFLGKLFLGLGDIQQLVRLQGFGSILGFTIGVAGCFSQYNLEICIFSLCLSSVLLGCTTIFLFKLLNTDKNVKTALNNSIKKENTKRHALILQTSQILQVFFPVVTQYLVILNFGSASVVTYLICQRIVYSIANIFGADFQHNLSIRNDSMEISIADISRFKIHLVIFLLAAHISLTFCYFFWGVFFEINIKPRFWEILSFAFVGLVILLDQIIRYRLYGLKKFQIDGISNLIFLFLVLVINSFFNFENFLWFNVFLVLAYLSKVIITFGLSMYLSYSR